MTRSDGTGPADAPLGLASLERQFVAHGRDPDGRDPGCTTGARLAAEMRRAGMTRSLSGLAKGNFNT